MSDRRWGEKPQPVKHYDTTKPIRGRIVYADGTESQFTYARMVNGLERLPVRVVIDGRNFTEDGIDLVEHMRDGSIYAVDLDGVRYVRAKERDWDSE